LCIKNIFPQNFSRIFLINHTPIEFENKWIENSDFIGTLQSMLKFGGQELEMNETIICRVAIYPIQVALTLKITLTTQDILEVLKSERLDGTCFGCTTLQQITLFEARL
jgi:hypothetical protein